MPKTVTAGNPKRKTGQLLARKDDAIRWFQREGFNLTEFIGLLNSEKELDQARNDLTQLNEYCKEEVQKVVHAHHKDFLEASRNIHDVEVLVDELRNYISGSMAVVANLVDLPSFPKQVAAESVLEENGIHEDQASSIWESIVALQVQLVQDLQVAVAEQDVSAARSLLNAGRDMIAIVDRDGGQLAAQVTGDTISGWRYAFESALAAQKAILIEELQRQLLQTNSSTLERRQAAQNLGLIVGPSQATQALLGCHSLRVRAAQQSLLKQHSAAGGDPDGVEYAGGLAQRTFLAIGIAAEDVQAVFPSPVAYSSGHQVSDQRELSVRRYVSDRGGQVAAVLPSVSALVVQWASDEARHCAALLCRHALTPFVATGMAVGALLCVGLALVFCVALESSHGLALRVAFMEELGPLLEAIVRRHLHRLREEASATAPVDATNAALRAVAGNALASGSSLPAGDSPLLAGFSETSALSAGLTQPASMVNNVSKGNESLASAAPAGLTCLLMLIPELKALVEGLVSLASMPAVAVLRQAVLAIFETVCDKVHASLTRLVGGGTSAVLGKNTANHDPLLAAYVLKAERALRNFAEVDVQCVLEPLAYVCGPIAPPEILLPSVGPLSALLNQLPEPAPEPAPAEFVPLPKQPSLQPQHSLGLLDRIRVELEAEQERRGRERDEWRSKEAFSQRATQPPQQPHPAAVAAGPSDLPSHGDRAPTAVTTATRQPKLEPPEQWSRQDVAQPGDGAAAGRGRVPQQAGDQSGIVANDSDGGHGRHQASGAAPLAGDGKARLGTAAVDQPEERSEPRRPRMKMKLVASEPRDERQQRYDTLRAADDKGSRSLQLEGSYEVEVLEGRSPSHRRHVPALDLALEGAVRDEGEDEVVESAVLRPRSRSRGRVRLGQMEPDGGEATKAVRDRSGATRRRSGQDRTVQFQQQPTAAGGAGVSYSDQEARTRMLKKDKACELRQPPQPASRQESNPVVKPGLAQVDEERDGGGEGRPPTLPATKFRRRALQPAQSELAVCSQGKLQPDGEDADAAAPPPRTRTVRREEAPEERESVREVEADEKYIPHARRCSPRGTRAGVSTLRDGDAEGQRQREPRRPRLEQTGREDNEDFVAVAAVGSMVAIPGSEQHAVKKQPLVTRGSVETEDDGAAADRPGGASDHPATVSVERSSHRLLEPDIKPTARKLNRFGVVLSDDEDQPVSAPKLRRPRAVKIGANAASAAALSGLEARQVVDAVGSTAAVQAEDVAGTEARSRGIPRRERIAQPDVQEAQETGNGVTENKVRPSRRSVIKDADRTPEDVERLAQEKPKPKQDPISIKTTGQPLQFTEASSAKTDTPKEPIGAVARSDDAVKPQTARERLAARMAAKAAAAHDLI